MSVAMTTVELLIFEMSRKETTRPGTALRHRLFQLTATCCLRKEFFLYLR